MEQLLNMFILSNVLVAESYIHVYGRERRVGLVGSLPLIVCVRKLCGVYYVYVFFRII